MNLFAFGRLAFAGAILCISASVTQSVNAAIPVPADLPPGDKYRLVFVTSGTTNATSADIAYYNSFVQGFADSAGLGPGWRAIATTPSVDARDNTGTSFDAMDNPVYSPDGIPVYRSDGMLVTLELWSNVSVNAAIELDETGSLVSGQVWTGSDENGRSSAVDVDTELGNTNPMGDAIVGFIEASEFWIEDDFALRDEEYPVYAISPILTVPGLEEVSVPIPPAALFCMAALIGLVGSLQLSRR